MSLTKVQAQKLLELKTKFDELKVGKENILKIIDEVEVSESVYNSNAIENSSLTLSDTEKVLIDLELSKNTSIREVFEVKNLARVINHLANKEKIPELNEGMILFLHNILLTGIKDEWAGRFRVMGELVKVGTHIAPAPQLVSSLIEKLLQDYKLIDLKPIHPVTKIAKFHLDFETIHPFCDGNGRVGRVLINYQLNSIGLPSIIIRDSQKISYYKSFDEYRIDNSTKSMCTVLALAIFESLHKRIAYLENRAIIKLSQYIKDNGLSSGNITNKAKSQTIPAFREKGVWMIGV